MLVRLRRSEWTDLLLVLWAYAIPADRVRRHGSHVVAELNAALGLALSGHPTDSRPPQAHAEDLLTLASAVTAIAVTATAGSGPAMRGPGATRP